MYDNHHKKAEMYIFLYHSAFSLLYQQIIPIKNIFSYYIYPIVFDGRR